MEISERSWYTLVATVNLQNLLLFALAKYSAETHAVFTEELRDTGARQYATMLATPIPDAQLDCAKAVVEDWQSRLALLWKPQP